MNETILKIENLEKTYPFQNKKALNNFSVEIKSGEKVGIVGANGSGKTTLFRLILNLIPADKGFIEVLGNRNLESAKKDVGFVPEHQQGLENFTPKELLYFSGRMSGMTKKLINKRSEELLHWIGLANESSKLISSFSKGMLQRVHLATALVNSPRLLLLDEPMSGLDPSGQVNLKNLLENLQDYTYLFTSHNLNDIESVCDRVLILNNGTLMEDISLKTSTREIFYLEGSEKLEEILDNTEGIIFRSKKLNKDSFSAEFIADNAVFQSFYAAANDAGISLNKIRSRSILEDLYLKHVSK